MRFRARDRFLGGLLSEVGTFVRSAWWRFYFFGRVSLAFEIVLLKNDLRPPLSMFGCLRNDLLLRVDAVDDPGNSSHRSFSTLVGTQYFLSRS